MKHGIFARLAPAADDHAGADGAVTRSAVPRISVVINTFNRANSLRQTLDGLTLRVFAGGKGRSQVAVTTVQGNTQTFTVDLAEVTG